MKLSDWLKFRGFSLPSTDLVVGNASNVPAEAAVTGDVTISATGVTTIGSGKVTEAMQVLADNTTGNVSASMHGYAPKVTNTAYFLKGDGTWAAPSAGSVAEADVTFTDITTNDASTSKHGYLKKLSNVSTEYMNGQGNWATPAGGAGLTLTTGTDAATTCASGNLYVVDMSAWATADRNYTMPASPTVGDRVGILVQAGNASYELIIKGNTSQTINGGSAASEWSRVFITGEYVELLYVATNAWLVVIDKRIPMTGAMYLSTAPGKNESATTFSYATERTTAGVWTSTIDVGSICTVGSERFTARRACNAWIQASGAPNSNMNDNTYWQIGITLNAGATEIAGAKAFTAYGTANWASISTSRNYAFALNDYIRMGFQNSPGGIGLQNGNDLTNFSFRELL